MGRTIINYLPCIQMGMVGNVPLFSPLIKIRKSKPLLAGIQGLDVGLVP